MTDAGEPLLRIFDIQRFSIHDGPGIRTTVFFNGCPLHCPWCANPESQRGRTELMHYANKCTRCGRCTAACPHNAVSFSPEAGPAFDREKCMRCGACAAACLSDAIRLSGQSMTVEEVLRVVRRDTDYYRDTGGGLTVSGGEPLLQPRGLSSLLQAARAEGISTAIETTGNVPEASFREILGLVDCTLFDLKHCDPAALRQTTGGDLALILRSLSLAAENGRVVVRVPVIPGFNHSPAVLEGIFSLAAERGVKEVDLLPYHVLGRSKYAQLGLPYRMDTEQALDKKELLPYVPIGTRKNIHVTISGREAAKIGQN